MSELRCHFTDGQTCPYCAFPFERVMGIVEPKPDDVTICPACLGIVVFDARLHPQTMSAETWAGVVEADRKRVFELRSSLLRIHAEHARRAEWSAVVN